MNNKVGFYQFHETNKETGELECLYCLVEEVDGKNKITYIKDYEEAKTALKEYFYKKSYSTLSDLKSDENFKTQLSNKEFRKLLKSKYELDSKDIENFNDLVGKESIENIVEGALEKDPKPVKKEGLLSKIKANLKTLKGKIILGVSLVACATAIAGGYKLSHNSKTSDMVKIETSDTKNNEDEVKKETFSDLYNLVGDSKAKYFSEFSTRLSGYNDLASTYQVNSNKLGLKTSELTAYNMALDGKNFGDEVTLYHKLPNKDEMYSNYLSAKDQVYQLAVVQEVNSGLAHNFDNASDIEFYQKYENKMIELNKAKDSDKIELAESYLEMVKSDFDIKDNINGSKEKLESDSKYLAVVPFVQALYDKTVNNNYDNSLNEADYNSLVANANEVAKNNISEAIDSITLSNDEVSYKDFMNVIEKEQEDLGIYPTENRDIRDSDMWRDKISLPVKEVKVETSTPTSSSTSSSGSSYNGDYVTYDPVDAELPSYETTDDNFVFDDSTNTDTNTDDNTNTNDNTNTDDNTNDNTNTDTPDINIIESEQEIVDGMNDTINSGGEATAPSDWEIDSEDKTESGTLDGAISDIEIVPSEDTSSNSSIIESEEDYTAPVVEEVPVVQEEVPTISVSEAVDAAISSLESGNEANIVYNTNDGSYTVEEVPVVQEETNSYSL